MEKGFVLLREFIYGWDFTEFDNDENIIIHEEELDALKELHWELEERPNDVDELMVANAYVDENNYVVAVDENGNRICKSDKPIQ